MFDPIRYSTFVGCLNWLDINYLRLFDLIGYQLFGGYLIWLDIQCYESIWTNWMFTILRFFRLTSSSLFGGFLDWPVPGTLEGKVIQGEQLQVWEGWKCTELKRLRLKWQLLEWFRMKRCDTFGGLTWSNIHYLAILWSDWISTSWGYLNWLEYHYSEDTLNYWILLTWRIFEAIGYSLFARNSNWLDVKYF